MSEITGDDIYPTADNICLTADGGTICDPIRKPRTDIEILDIETDIQDA